MLSVPHHHAPFQEELELLFNTLAGHPDYMGLSKTGLGYAEQSVVISNRVEFT